MIPTDSITRCCVLFSALFLLATQPVFAFWPFDSEAEVLTADCEALLMDRLTSPSSYVRIKVGEVMRDDGDLDDFLGFISPRIKAEELAREASEPNLRSARDTLREIFRRGNLERVMVMITYDADNSYGASLRSQSVCSAYVTKGNDYRDETYRQPRLDGMTEHDWQMMKVRGLIDSM